MVLILKGSIYNFSILHWWKNMYLVTLIWKFAFDHFSRLSIIQKDTLSRCWSIAALRHRAVDT